ncbi:MAG: cytochrome c [Anaerolineae bacterium]|nr:cytochrome c [Anaerolineae bacterium]
MAAFRCVTHNRKLTLFLSLVALALASCQGLAGEPRVVATLPPQAPSAALSVPQEAPDLALGAQVYAANCTRCHGVTGQGDGEFVLSGQIPSIIDFTDPATIEGKTPADYFQIVTEGRMDLLMPPWADKLSETERWAVANYVYNLSSSEPAQVAQAQPTAAPATGAEVQTTEEPSPGAEVQTTEEPGATGVVSGQLTNGTAGGSIPDGQVVRLFAVDAQFESQIFETTANADGSFRLEDIPMRSDLQYVLTAEYNDIRFMSEFATIDDSTTELTLPISIYETSNDPSIIQIDAILNQVIAADGGLQVVQVVSYTNTSDHVFLNVTDDGATSVSIAVPDGAIYQNFTSSDYVVSEDGSQVFDTQPVLPGEQHLMHVAFGMPYPNNQATVAQVIPYAVDGSYEVLVASGGLTVAGDLLAEQGMRQVGSSTMMSYAGQMSTPPETSVSYVVSGAPVADASTQTSSAVTSDNLVSYVLIIFGVLAIVLAAFLFLRDRRARPLGPVIVATAEAQSLIEQIATLDRDHDAGKVTHKAYERKRAALKAQLAELMRDDQK